MMQNLDTKNIQIKFILHMKSGTPLFVSTKKHLFISDSDLWRQAFDYMNVW